MLYWNGFIFYFIFSFLKIGIHVIGYHFFFPLKRMEDINFGEVALSLCPMFWTPTKSSGFPKRLVNDFILI